MTDDALKTDDLDSFGGVEDSPVESLDADALPMVVTKIKDSDKRRKWQANVPLNFGTKNWVPAAVMTNRKGLLHIVVGADLPRYVMTRLVLAKSQGYQIHLAVAIEHFYNAELLDALAGLDARVYVLDDARKERQYKPRHFMAAMADLQVPVAPAVRKAIGREVWKQLGDGSKKDRGQRLEAILAYLFDQVSDLRVIERNYRNQTQEIDLVLQLDNHSNRCWHQPGVPFILVEAKNTATPATQQMVNVLVSKIRTKRQRAQLGFLVCPAGFTEDARLEELRYSESSTCVVMLDRKGIEELIGAEDLDHELERYVRQALLR